MGQFCPQSSEVNPDGHLNFEFSLQVVLVIKDRPVIQETQEMQETAGLSPGSGRKSPWSRKWQPAVYSCLGNPMDREAWWATIPGLAKSWTRLSN